MNNNTRFVVLHQRVLQDIRVHCPLQAGNRLLLAVSGGQDSLCLAKIFYDIAPKFNWQLVIAHLDHGWRTDSAQAAQVVQKLAQDWQLPFYLKVAAIAPATEAAARVWRYDWLGQLAQQIGATAVLTGHTASDRTETLLFNLLRGGSLGGANSLDWQRPLTPEVSLVRPLLGVTRAETGAFCEAENLPVYIDTTNADLTFQRNRLRLELIPYLQMHFNPQVSRHLAQTAEILQAEEAYWETLVADWFGQLYQAHPPALKRNALRALPIALQRRIIHRFLDQQAHHRVSFRAVEMVRALLDQPTTTRTASLSQGQGVIVRGIWLVWE